MIVFSLAFIVNGTPFFRSEITHCFIELTSKVAAIAIAWGYDVTLKLSLQLHAGIRSTNRMQESPSDQLPALR